MNSGDTLVRCEGLLSGRRIGGMIPELKKAGSCIMSNFFFGGIVSLSIVTKRGDEGRVFLKAFEYELVEGAVVILVSGGLIGEDISSRGESLIMD